MSNLKQRVNKIESKTTNECKPAIVCIEDRFVQYINEKFKSLEQLKKKYPHITEENILLWKVNVVKTNNTI